MGHDSNIYAVSKKVADAYVAAIEQDIEGVPENPSGQYFSRTDEVIGENKEAFDTDFYMRGAHWLSDVFVPKVYEVGLQVFVLTKNELLEGIKDLCTAVMDNNFMEEFRFPQHLGVLVEAMRYSNVFDGVEDVEDEDVFLIEASY